MEKTAGKTRKSRKRRREIVRPKRGAEQEPTPILYVANCGLRTGATEKLVVAACSRLCETSAQCFPNHTFICFHSSNAAQHFKENLQQCSNKFLVCRLDCKSIVVQILSRPPFFSPCNRGAKSTPSSPRLMILDRLHHLFDAHLRASMYARQLIIMKRLFPYYAHIFFLIT